jgi:DNA/RNA-binding protein KIN17
MEIFGQNPTKIVDAYSRDFETSFLEHLRRTHPFSRVAANLVYNEFIHDRNHVHMNSTKWITLSDFVKYLGREGKCKVEDTDKGWFITLIHKEAQDLEKRKLKKEQTDRDAEERQGRVLAAQVERAHAAAAAAAAAAGRGGGGPDELDDDIQHELDREKLDQCSLGFSLQNVKGLDRGTTTNNDGRNKRSAFDAVGVADDMENGKSSEYAQDGHHRQKKKSKLEELIERDLKAKASKQQLQQEQQETAAATAALESNIYKHWIRKNIVVKVMSPALKPHGYYKQKGTILDIIDGHIAEIEMLGSGDVVRVDEAELETVVPRPGGMVVIVGRGEKVKGLVGEEAELEKIDTRAYQAKLRIKRGPHAGQSVWCEYDDFSKLDG